MATKKKTKTKRKAKPRRARPKAQPFTSKKRDLFFTALAEQGNVSHACRVAEISRERVYSLRRTVDEFADRWERAEQQAADRLEAEAWRRGLEGTDDPLAFQGMLTGDTIRRYSDTLLIFLMKGARPNKYRELRGVDVTSGGKPVTNAAVNIYLPANGREAPGDD